MNLVDFKRKLIGVYINSLGWKTDRKIVVFESDDWGSIRMPNKETYQELLEKKLPVDSLPYLKFDSLETKDDFNALFDLLVKFKDSNGNHPIITANTILSNPNFEKIKESGYQNYINEMFFDSYEKYSGENLLSYYFQGIQEKIFYPQLHGREHLNVNRWMNSLKNDLGLSRELFDFGLYDLSVSQTNISENSFVDALTPANNDELDYVGESIKEASIQFKEVFGFQSKSFIAPCYIWRPETEKFMKQAGIDFIQTGAYQLIPEIGKINQFKKKFHFTGQKNTNNQIYSVRNGIFEPSLTLLSQDVNYCLKQIAKAFNHKKPAIISTHRINFIGSIDEKNRNQNLILFKNLLSEIIKIWPDIEFMHTIDLGNIISKND
jgi:hypothetical protein